MKPILERWRKTIANAPPAKPMSRGPGGPATALQEGAQTWEAKPWDETGSFLDLPKSLVGSFRIPGQYGLGEISPEAVMLYGLSPQERESIRILYNQMKARLEKLESDHLDRPDAMRSSFVLRPFPEENALLQREWMQKLKEIIGATRAELLDKAMRVPVTVATVARGRGAGGPALDLRTIVNRGPEWLVRGTNTLRIDVTFQKAADGSQSQQIEYQEGNGRGTMRGKAGDVPERWRHLLTPEMLRPLVPPVAF